MRSSLYRSRQFFSALLGRVSLEEMREAQGVLGHEAELYTLFETLPGQYRHHMLAVYRRVRRSGCDDINVWQAALLHDSGKYDPESGKYVKLPYRVIIVLLKAVPAGKRLYARLSQPSRTARQGASMPELMRWRYPFYLNKHHAELGAREAAQRGASSEVVRLIADHHKYGSQNPSLQALQQADEHS